MHNMLKEFRTLLPFSDYLLNRQLTTGYIT